MAEFPDRLQITHAHIRPSVQCWYSNYSHITALLFPLKIHQYIGIKTDLVFLLVAKLRQEKQAKLAPRSL